VVEIGSLWNRLAGLGWLHRGFLALNLLVLPGLFSLAVWTSQKFTGKKLPLKQEIANQSQALLPLGLMAWIAFTISFASPKLGYVLVVLNDPLGWVGTCWAQATPSGLQMYPVSARFCKLSCS